MACNRRHRATITVSLSLSLRPLRDGGEIFFSPLIIYKCLLIIPLEGIVHIRLQQGGVAAKRSCEKTPAGVLQALCPSLRPLHGSPWLPSAPLN